MLTAADNLQIIKPAIYKAVMERDPEPIRKIVKECLEGGADIIDVNTGPLTKTPREAMTFIVNTVQEVTDLPLMIDTANPAAMEAGLQACEGRAIINGFSLESRKLKGILPLAVKFDADIVGYLLSSESRVPSGSEERLCIALELLTHMETAGLSPDRLIIDPVLVPLTWGDGKKQLTEVMTVLRMLPEMTGRPIKTIAGLSNITAGCNNQSKRIRTESAVIPMLIKAGLSTVLLNITHKETMDVIRTCKSFLSPGPFSWEEMG